MSQQHKNKHQSTAPLRATSAAALVPPVAETPISPVDPIDAEVVSVSLRGPNGSPVFSSTYIFTQSNTPVLVELDTLRWFGPGHIEHLVNHPDLVVTVVR